MAPHDLLAHVPAFDPAAAAALARAHFGWEAAATPLPSERDQNFLLTTDAGERMVLKIANAAEDPALLTAQQLTLAHLAARGVPCPRVHPTLTGAPVAWTAAPAGRRHAVWAVTYLPGRPLGQLRRPPPALWRDFGRRIGELNAALQPIDHPALHRAFHWDLATGVAVVSRELPRLGADALGAAVRHWLAAFARHTAPQMDRLPLSLVHNDLNDYNVLVTAVPGAEAPTITGLLDFGDMVHSYRVADLAVAAAYAVLDKDDTLAVIAELVRGHQAVNPLTEAELGALYGLLGLRLCLSASLAAFQQAERPDNAYLAITQAPLRRTLPRLLAIPFGLAEAVIREAAGLPPVPAAARVTAWLGRQTSVCAPVLPADLRTAPAAVLDLGVGSPWLEGDPTANPEPALTARLMAAVREHNAVVGVGQYDEPRLIYSAPFFAAGPDPLGERRAIHLGLDLFAPPGTPVFAPLAGVVHAFADNAQAQDYGPVIVLRHHPEPALTFYTLYGHLSRESLVGLQVGQTVARGQQLGTLGEAAVNGGWPPHLHLQVITDLLGLDTDFPGVGRASQREVWRALSPDPNLLVGVPADRFPPPAPSLAETLAARRQRLGRNLSLAYREPLKIVRGWRQYLFDHEGRRYLDAYNNVPHVGHAHPAVVRAGRAQMGVLNTNTRYLHDLVNGYAERLTATLPAPLSVCYFVNSASEANELALRLARAYTGHRDMVVLEAAYHGHTTGLIDLSPYKHAGPGGTGAPEWVHVAPLPDDYRGPFKRSDPLAGPKYAAQTSALIDQLAAAGRGLAGFIAETCPSVGGQIFLPPGYLPAVYARVRAAGGVCIADEVQTGYGRIGTHFWAFEAHGVTPDIVVMGKPIGNGHPIGAVVTTPAIAAAFDNGMEFFSTFGGNPVSSAIGLAVLEVVQAEGLPAHARAVGERLLTGLRPLITAHPLVGDVRGSGLFLGVELVRDRETLTPADQAASHLVNRLRARGILLGTDGPYHNVIKIRPPMPFDHADADLLVTALAEALHDDFPA